MRKITFRHTILAGAVAGLLAAIMIGVGPSAVYGQSFPTIGDREDLVYYLNQAMNEALSTGQDRPVVLLPSNGDPNSPHYTIDPTDPASVDGCLALDPNPLELVVSASGNTFTVTRTLTPASTAQMAAWSGHELANDLNSWLNRAWGLPLVGEEKFTALLWQCDSDPDRFFTSAIARSSANPGVADEVFDPVSESVHDLTGSAGILDKYYDVNGTFRKGSEMLTFSYGEPDQSTNAPTIKYVVDRGDPNDPVASVRRRYLSYAKLEVDLDVDQSVDFSITISFQTTYVSAASCGISKDETTSYPDPETSKDFLINLYPADPSGDHLCEFGWFSNSLGLPNNNTYEDGLFVYPDSSTKRLLRYIEDHQGEWRYNPEGESLSANGRTLQLGAFRTDDQGRLWFTRQNSGCCDKYEVDIGPVESYDDPPEEECAATFCAGGEFFLDPVYKMIYYSSPTIPGTSGVDCIPCGVPGVTIPDLVVCPECNPPTAVPLLCVQFCDSALPSPATIDLTLSSSATVFSDRVAVVSSREYIYDPGNDVIAPESANDFETGDRGKWRVQSQYVYRDEVKSGTALLGDPTDRIYLDAGTYDLPFFNLNYPELSETAGWIRPTEITSYSRNGEPVEEQNIIQIPSVAHFGYDEQLPVLVATNAAYHSVFFNSFEDLQGSGMSLGHRIAHSGEYSLHLEAELGDASPTKLEEGVRVGTLLLDKSLLPGDASGPNPCGESRCGGVLMRFWAKPFFNVAFPGDPLLAPVCPVGIAFRHSGQQFKVVSDSDIRFVAKTGEWALWEVEYLEFQESDILDVNDVPISYDVMLYARDLATAAAGCYVDDFRLQPIASEMVCFVYEIGQYRQIAQFDDQHFGLFYQYNSEGKLVRKLRETERGVKLVQETQYNSPLITRDVGSSNITYTQSSVGSGSQSNASLHTERSGSGWDVDVMTLQLSADSIRFEAFGASPSELAAVFQSLRQEPELTGFLSLPFGDLEKVALADSLLQLDREREVLVAQLDSTSLDSATAVEVREQLSRNRDAIAALLTRMGIETDSYSSAVSALRRLDRYEEEKSNIIESENE